MNMTPESIFSVTSSLAGIGWLVLVFAKGSELPKKVLWWFLVPLLGLGYSVLVAVYLFQSGGGFGTPAGVRQLFSNDWLVLAGWVHYLLFDFAVGVYLSEDMNKQGLDRFFRGVLLLLVFFAGPLGVFVYYCFRFVGPLLSGLVQRIYRPYFSVEDMVQSRAFTVTLWGISLCLSLLPVLLGAYVLDARTVDLVPTWIKPIKFAVSIAIHMLAVLVLMPLLTVETLKRRALVFWSVVASYSLVFEIYYICLQAARARASHFNSQTGVEQVMYGLMGVGAVTAVVGSFVLGYYVYRYCREQVAAPVRSGVYLGLMLGSVLTVVVAGYIGSSRSHFVVPGLLNVNQLPLLGWSRIYGDLRVSHFFALHTVQALPLLGALLVYYGVRSWKRWLYGFAVVLTVLVAWTFVQALSNVPFIR